VVFAAPSPSHACLDGLRKSLPIGELHGRPTYVINRDRSIAAASIGLKEAAHLAWSRTDRQKG